MIRGSRIKECKWGDLTTRFMRIKNKQMRSVEAQHAECSVLRSVGSRSASHRNALATRVKLVELSEQFRPVTSGAVRCRVQIRLCSELLIRFGLETFPRLDPRLVLKR